MGLVSDQLWESLPANGWLQRDEAELLMEVAGETDGPILEVGCYYGRSTCLLASLRRVVYSVDPFSNFDSDDPSGNIVLHGFQHNLADRAIHNVILSRCSIEDWDKKPIGFAYLDGDHTYEGTLRQIDTAIECGAVEMCIHDYDTNPNGGGIHILNAIKHRPLELVEVVKTMAHCRYIG